MFNHFHFESGANPYITTTAAAFRRMMRKYRGKVRKVKDGFYMVSDRESGGGLW